MKNKLINVAIFSHNDTAMSQVSLPRKHISPRPIEYLPKLSESGSNTFKRDLSINEIGQYYGTIYTYFLGSFNKHEDNTNSNNKESDNSRRSLNDRKELSSSKYNKYYQSSLPNYSVRLKPIGKLIMSSDLDQNKSMTVIIDNSTNINLIPQNSTGNNISACKLNI